MIHDSGQASRRCTPAHSSREIVTRPGRQKCWSSSTTGSPVISPRRAASTDLPAAPRPMIVDSVFAFRPGYNSFWDYRIWLETGAGLALRRGIARDAAREGAQGAEQVHRDRYHAAEMIYTAEVGSKLLGGLRSGAGQQEAR